jgi:zinc/manganese transport system substrate-binding protein
MVQVAKRDGVRAIVVENYYDTKSADTVARFSGAKVVQTPGDVGGERGIDTYERYIDVLVSRIAGALR